MLDFLKTCIAMSVRQAKKLFRFVDLVIIFKVEGGQKYVKFSINLRILMHLWLDSHQTYMDILLGQSQELTVFW